MQLIPDCGMSISVIDNGHVWAAKQMKCFTYILYKITIYIQRPVALQSVQQYVSLYKH